MADNNCPPNDPSCSGEIISHIAKQTEINKNLEEKVDSMHELLSNMHKALFVGNGQPGMKTTIEKVDSHHKTFEDNFEKHHNSILDIYGKLDDNKETILKVGGKVETNTKVMSCTHGFVVFAMTAFYFFMNKFYSKT